MKLGTYRLRSQRHWKWRKHRKLAYFLLRSVYSSQIPYFWSESLDSEGLIFFNSLYVLDISPASEEQQAKIFPHSVGCIFTLFIISFAMQKIFNRMGSQLLILCIISYGIRILFMKSVPMFMTLRVILILFSFIQFLFNIYITTHFDFCLVHGGMDKKDEFFNTTWVLLNYTKG